ncbi:4-hydroxy-tetrahydrodipicolinate synthase [Paludisphaera rhizosphaerae]|uniref:4-hydroxy-tetrahydrodipicolinate synthase n=1 Tax=Paludisphaera rhizosphaerae TaxID=2711216 RepID=UPI0013E9F00E|nr:4-hydroxy-tetrahydrodipicolinate synthase [Paludisphaera rhizosphaerae]
MASKGNKFAGCTVALATPFKDGEVDEPALRGWVEWQIEQGTPILSPVGTTGEAPTLSHLEHERVIAIVVETAAGRAKVMAGTGSNSTAEAIRLTKFAARAGADGALMVAPYYNRPSQEGMYRHFATVAEAVDLPIILYNIPARTGRNMEPETIERLASLDTIVAIKEAAGSLDQVSDILARTNLTVLSGDDSLTLPMMAVGAEGVVSVAANIVPRDVRGLIDDFNTGDAKAARERHARLFPLCRDLLGLAPNPVPLKSALALLGRGNGEIRLPLCPLNEVESGKLSRALARYGLIQA